MSAVVVSHAPESGPKTRLRDLRAQVLPAIPILWLLVVVLAAVFPSLFTSIDPYRQVLTDRLRPPGTDGHVLGTDGLGRDLYARLIYGARPTVLVATSALLLSAFIGVTVGMVAGMSGRWIDRFLMRLTDTILSLPLILLSLFLVILLGPSISNVILAIGVLAWSRYARVVRAETLIVNNTEYVSHARLSGVSRTKILLQHLFPNVLPVVVVLVTLQVGWVVMVEASLSFLGAGVPPPDPSWGGMVAEGRNLMLTAWWVSAVPGLLILTVVVALNTLGDALRDRYDPALTT
jgi:peptide/nickel transport system permease protein